jgi:hypothetical protein
LRYITFKTLRHFHPHSRIQLYVSDKYKKDGSIEVRQEFNSPDIVQKDYMHELSKLDVEIIPMDRFSRYFPNHQSDFFRWWYLSNFGGFYLDTDQIILRSFKKLPLKKNNFIYSSYEVDSPFAFDGKFSPVGVLGSAKGIPLAEYMLSQMKKYYEETNYNALGPLMFADVLSKLDMKKAFNAPPEYFYPAPICDYTDAAYSGKMKIPNESLAFHWFGGYAPSQTFNKKFSEEFAKTSNDTISTFLRSKGLV